MQILTLRHVHCVAWRGAPGAPGRARGTGGARRPGGAAGRAAGGRGCAGRPRGRAGCRPGDRGVVVVTCTGGGDECEGGERRHGVTVFLPHDPPLSVVVGGVPAPAEPASAPAVAPSEASTARRNA